MPSTTIPIGFHAAHGRPPRVAIVDGNAANSMLTSLLVEQFGCTALKATTGEAALALLRSDGNVDLVLIDLSIPDMDGVVLALLIREMQNHAAMPIIPLASSREELNASRSRAAGFSGGLMKPYSPSELYAAIVAALDRAPVSATV